uniref:Uncharacterized protein n=1 Tax=Chromera velia CCMP2878 TaxID=1169474 RepID=A0A0G4HDT5_9ALVE|eukprot:Cvel_26589.t1-p1 / transcript=Cvel_26589.t1 / gene=Cvel_26589 / organism=Chromera_velia_CCMP2878 / gene_product=hypothetical protein / transcript_product=hypothetical protein / location=Cvel_scaffold3185:3731-10152(+) / protein_length=768 / sequence_SO=supercontig / SO=protein_coding / is_pseudo=false
MKRALTGDWYDYQNNNKGLEAAKDLQKRYLGFRIDFGRFVLFSHLQENAQTIGSFFSLHNMNMPQTFMVKKKETDVNSVFSKMKCSRDGQSSSQIEYYNRSKYWEENSLEFWCLARSREVSRMLDEMWEAEDAEYADFVKDTWQVGRLMCPVENLNIQKLKRPFWFGIAVLFLLLFDIANVVVMQTTVTEVEFSVHSSDLPFEVRSRCEEIPASCEEQNIFSCLPSGEVERGGGGFQDGCEEPRLCESFERPSNILSKKGDEGDGEMARRGEVDPEMGASGGTQCLLEAEKADDTRACEKSPDTPKGVPPPQFSLQLEIPLCRGRRLTFHLDDPPFAFLLSTCLVVGGTATYFSLVSAYQYMSGYYSHQRYVNTVTYDVFSWLAFSGYCVSLFFPLQSRADTWLTRSCVLLLCTAMSWPGVGTTGGSIILPGLFYLFVRRLIPRTFSRKEAEAFLLLNGLTNVRVCERGEEQFRLEGVEAGEKERGGEEHEGGRPLQGQEEEISGSGLGGCRFVFRPFRPWGVEGRGGEESGVSEGRVGRVCGCFRRKVCTWPFWLVACCCSSWAFCGFPVRTTRKLAWKRAALLFLALLGFYQLGIGGAQLRSLVRIPRLAEPWPTLVCGPTFASWLRRNPDWHRDRSSIPSNAPTCWPFWYFILLPGPVGAVSLLVWKEYLENPKTLGTHRVWFSLAIVVLVMELAGLAVVASTPPEDSSGSEVGFSMSLSFLSFSLSLKGFWLPALLSRCRRVGRGGDSGRTVATLGRGGEARRS